MGHYFLFIRKGVSMKDIGGIIFGIVLVLLFIALVAAIVASIRYEKEKRKIRRLRCT
jgi:hypothetical protein